MHYILARNDENVANSKMVTLLGILSMTLSLIANLKNLDEVCVCVCVYVWFLYLQC